MGQTKFRGSNPKLRLLYKNSNLDVTQSNVDLKSQQSQQSHVCRFARAADQFGQIVCAQVNYTQVVFFARSLLRLGNIFLSFCEDCGTDFIWTL